MYMLKFLNKIRFFCVGNSISARSVGVRKNIFLGFLVRGGGIVVTLLIVPLTIGYVNPEQYGLWLTISSIVAWIGNFDLGLSHGFRNRFAESKANQDYPLAQKYVSTTYALLVVIFSLLFVVFYVINQHLDWVSFLGVKQSNNEELVKVFSVLIFFFCLQMVLKTITVLFLADQKPALSNFILTMGQVVSLVVIFILTKTTEGSLLFLAYALSGMPCLILVITTVIAFSTKYRMFLPRIKSVDRKLIKSIIGLGGKFFIIQISMLFIFQFTNIILSRYLGSNVVTQYNIAYKYFVVLHILYNIIILPFWTAFTDAYTQQDYTWMRTSYKKLLQSWVIVSVCSVIMLVISPIAYRLWIGTSLVIPVELSVVMFLYVLVMNLAALHMQLINGIGKVFLQLIVYVSASIVSIPLMIIFATTLGVVGVLIVPISVYLIQFLLGYLQIKKLLNKKAYNWWNK